MARERPSKKRIQAILNQRINPLVALDDATVEAIRYVRDNGRVEVRFGGGYAYSPARDTLTRLMIEPILSSVFWGIKQVDYLD